MIIYLCYICQLVLQFTVNSSWNETELSTYFDMRITMEADVLLDMNNFFSSHFTPNTNVLQVYYGNPTDK